MYFRRRLVAAVVLAAAACAGCRALTTSFGESEPQKPLLESATESAQKAAADLPKKVGSVFTKKEPTNDGDWIPEQTRLSWAESKGDQVTIHNVRNCKYYTYSDCVCDWSDKTYDVDRLKSVDFILVPFAENPSIAHTMLSFGFDDGEQVGVSVEVRLEKGEQYDAAVGLMGQFELMYVIAEERELICCRVEHRDVDVYLYPTIATREQTKRLFIDMLKRANKLKKEPEFYDTLSNNCTTNIVRHINALAPGKVPHDYRVLLPGFSDKLAYDLGLIDNRLPFEELKSRCRVNDVALRYKDHPQFSQKIRAELRR